LGPVKPYNTEGVRRALQRRVSIIIREDKPVAAGRQIAKFFHTFQMLAKNFELGQRRPELGSDLRVFSVGNYAIVYRRVFAARRAND
jgi:plasmid stabilization system protein ParE